MISNSFENSLHFWALKSFFLDNYLFFLLGVAFLHILWQKVINFESLNAQLWNFAKKMLTEFENHIIFQKLLNFFICLQFMQQLYTILLDIKQIADLFQYEPFVNNWSTFLIMHNADHQSVFRQLVSLKFTFKSLLTILGQFLIFEYFAF